MIEKNTEFNESVFVLYHVLSSISQNFDGRFPPEISEEIENLMHKLMDYIDGDIEDGYEIKDIKYFRQLVLSPDNRDNNQEQTNEQEKK